MKGSDGGGSGTPTAEPGKTRKVRGNIPEVPPEAALLLHGTSLEPAEVEPEATWALSEVKLQDRYEAAKWPLMERQDAAAACV